MTSAANDAVRIRTFEPREWRLYRQLRLAALEDAPEAFGSTYEEAIARPEDAWRSRIADCRPSRDLPLLGEIGDRPAGLAWSVIEAEHTELAHLFQMWVQPDCRGHGVARALLDHAVAWARRQGARRMLLAVTCGNEPARRLYEQAGFVEAGPPEPLRPGAALLEQPMALQL